MTPPRHRRPGRTAASSRISSSLAALLHASSYEQISLRVRRARLDIGLNQDALGQPAGLERSPIGNIEKGRQKPAPAFRILVGRPSRLLTVRR
jgi:DNA-binding XRE family transcriptional regulator